MQILVKNLKYFGALVISAGFVFGVHTVFSAAPSGSDWFQLLVSTSTGGDNTGDGGTGLNDDLNYYYVGQSVSQTIQINSSGTDAANIWIDYDDTIITPSNLNVGTYFPSWAGQTINATINRILSTGFDLSSVSSGTGNFGSFDIDFDAPTALSLDTSSPSTLDINTGTIGLTTESNISLLGSDILDDEEDFNFHVWADITKPYAENPTPADNATGVAINSTFSFDLRDTRDGEGDTSGVGTGVNTSTPPGSITVDDGSGPIDYTAFDSYSCSGIWGTNLCLVTVNPTSPLSIGGDSRNWEYNTTYTITISGYQDLASSSQNQLGEPNGPNTMDPKIWTFTTVADTVAPQVTAQTPTIGSSGAATDTNIVITVLDKASYPSGASGVGVDASTCSFNISSASFPLTTFQQGDAEVTVTAVDYGYQFIINPTSNFGQNETVSVSAFDCADTAGNVMTTDNWTFSTSDSSSPYLDQISPADDAIVQPDSNISFHILDDGSGVDLSSLVVYVNGQYYSSGGGPVSVTTTGTSITAANSLDINGGNYIGDTTGVSGTSSDYTITIDPQTDFTGGETVVIIVYAKDSDGNLMEREVYAVVVDGAGLCADGDTFCGANSLWNGAKCVGTIPPGSGNSSSNSPLSSILGINNATVTQIDETSVLVTIQSNQSAQAWVAYGSGATPANYGEEPNFGYENISIVSDTNSTYHTFEITNLQPGVLYNFLPIIKTGEDTYARGNVLRMAPVFATQYIEVEKVITEVVEVPAQGGETEIVFCAYQFDENQLGTSVPENASGCLPVVVTGDGTLIVNQGNSFDLELINSIFTDALDAVGYITISALAEVIKLEGRGIPGDIIKIIIY